MTHLCTQKVKRRRRRGISKWEKGRKCRVMERGRGTVVNEQ
jgi:hypothetical protein